VNENKREVLVCRNCAYHEIFKEIIKNNGKMGKCSFCNKRMKCINVIELLQYINDRLKERFLSIKESDYTFGAPSSTDEILEQWERDFFWEANDDFYNFICMIITDKWIDPYSRFLNNPYLYMKTEWSSYEKLIKENTRFFITHKKGKGENKVEQMFNLIINFFEKMKLVKMIPRYTTIYRVKLHPVGSELRTAEELGPPQEGSGGDNRFSPKGVAAFYGSSHPELALHETLRDLGTNPNLNITVGKWETLKPLKILDLTDPPIEPSIFRKNSMIDVVAPIFIRDFIHELRKIADKYKMVYVPIQAFTEYLKDKIYISGIKFISSLSLYDFDINGDGNNVNYYINLPKSAYGYTRNFHKYKLQLIGSETVHVRDFSREFIERVKEIKR
jgi:hypothetical protein